jgi:uncharacterized protein
MGQNKDVIQGLYEAFGRGDVPAVLGTLDSEIQWSEADGISYADGNPYSSPGAVASGVFQRIVTDVEQFSVTPQRLIEAGDTVVAEGRYTGTMKTTGTPLDAQFAHVWQLRDGKVIRFQQYTDTKQWADAAGTRAPA